MDLIPGCGASGVVFITCGTYLSCILVANNTLHQEFMVEFNEDSVLKLFAKPAHYLSKVEDTSDLIKTLFAPLFDTTTAVHEFDDDPNCSDAHDALPDIEQDLEAPA